MMKDRQKRSGSRNNFRLSASFPTDCGKLSGRISIEKLGGKLASCLGKSTGAPSPVLLQSLTTLRTLPGLCNTCVPPTTLTATLHPFHDPPPSTFYPACIASSHTLPDPLYTSWVPICTLTDLHHACCTPPPSLLDTAL